MIEVVTRERAPEMAARYLNTYGFIKSSAGKKILVQILDVANQYVEAQDAKGNRYTLASDTGCELEFTQVPTQWFQPDPDHIAYVNRRPDRQYKRGICSGNTNIFVPVTDGTKLQSCDTTVDKIDALFNKDSEIQPFRRYNKIKCGLWSKFFAWAVNTVYCKDLAIGKVDHDLNIITLDNDMFIQEMRDALNRSNSNYVVKVKE